jgi:hypothetical protein
MAEMRYLCETVVGEREEKIPLGARSKWENNVQKYIK